MPRLLVFILFLYFWLCPEFAMLRVLLLRAPPHSAVVANWSKSNFGQLSYSKWGEVVFE
jgi:hypothetical protein